MAELSRAEDLLLERLKTRRPWFRASGIFLALLGAIYAIWGMWIFDPAADPRTQSTFDKPVARIAYLYEGHHRGLQRLKTNTVTEKVLVDVMQNGMNFSAGMLLMLLRLFLGTLVSLAGLVILTVVLERQRLEGMISRLRE